MAVEDKYIKMAWAEHLRLLREDEERLLRILKASEKETVRLIMKMGNGTLTRQHYENIQRELKVLIDTLSVKLGKEINEKSKMTAEDYVKWYEKAFLLRAGKFSGMLDVTFDAVPIRAVEAALKNVKGLKLSENLYNFSQYSQTDLEDMMISGIARGQSAAEMAKTARKFFTASGDFTDEELADFRRVTGERRGIAHKLAANAKRLTGTSINNAYHQAQIEASEKDPTVLGDKWNLSLSHRFPCVCELLASQNPYGLGEGVYPAGKTPEKPHPSCLCFLTTVARPIEEWSKSKTDINLVEDWDRFGAQSGQNMPMEERYINIIKRAA
jgi:hypothetical protein